MGDSVGYGGLIRITAYIITHGPIRNPVLETLNTGHHSLFPCLQMWRALAWLIGMKSTGQRSYGNNTYYGLDQKSGDTSPVSHLILHTVTSTFSECNNVSNL